MKYYSETLNQLFNSEKDLITAENKAKETEEAKKKAEIAKKEARATRAKEVDKALKEADAATMNAQKLLKEFIKDYGSYHTSYELSDIDNLTTNSFIDLLTSFLGDI